MLYTREMSLKLSAQNLGNWGICVGVSNDSCHQTGVSIYLPLYTCYGVNTVEPPGIVFSFLITVLTLVIK